MRFGACRCASAEASAALRLKREEADRDLMKRLDCYPR